MTRPTHTPGSEGVRSEALRLALKAALAGRPGELEALLCRYGNLPGRANLKLALAFGDEVSAQTGNLAAVLTRLAQDDAGDDTARVFLPVAAAHGWCARLRAGHDVELAWNALAALAADERVPVRLGTIDALVEMSAHPGSADALIERASIWLEETDRDLRFGTAAAVLEVLGNAQAAASLRDRQAALAYLSRVIAAIADAPRSATRSEARRRALAALPRVLCGAVARAFGEEGANWLERECEQAEQRQIREVLSDTILRLHRDPRGLGRAVVDRLRKTLEASAAPLRDGVVLRPGTERGKAGRKIR